MKMKRSLTIPFTVYFLIILIPGMARTQNVQRVDSLFFEGIASYRYGNYRETLRMMELLDQTYPNHQRRTGSLLIQGKSLYKLQEYRRSLEVFRRIIGNYPQSQYLDDALYGIATVYFRMNLMKEAVKQLMMVVDEGKDIRLQRKAAKLSSDILDFHVGDENLRELLEDVPGERGKAAITLRLAKREMDKLHFQTTRKTLQNFLNKYPNSSYVTQMVQLLEEAEEMGKGFLKVGIILPLTGPFSEQGNALLEGIQYAVDVHNEGNGAKVELVIRDSEGSIIQAIKVAQELCGDEEILAVIGELESELTAAIAAVAQEKGIILLAPTATLDGITSIGSTIFQVNGSLSVRARILAEYAVSGLGLRRFAILAPVGEYGKSMRDSFVESINELGGEILAENWFFEESEDLGPQFKAIREAGLRKMLQDSVIVRVPERLWDERYEHPEDGIIYVKQNFSELVDSTELAVTAYDGIFFPVYTEDLPYVMPQLASYNIQARIFGGAFWHDLEALKNHQRYIDGAFFLSDFFIEPSDFSFHNLRDKYRQAKGKTPEKMEILGYDTANLLLEVVGEKALPREQIGEQLATMGRFSGIRGTISFNEDRINPYLRILQYRGGQIIQIK